MSLSPGEWEALALSLKVSLWAIAVALPLALAAALLLSRGRFPGRSLLDALVHLPLVLPPVVTGYLLLVAFGRRGMLGAWLEQAFGLVFAFRWTGAALAAGIMAFPLMVRPIRLSLDAIDHRLEAAAGTLGASRPAIFATVTLPLALPGILVAAVMGFAKALGEFGATITFVSNIPGETRTLPIAIYTLLQTPRGEAAALRLCLVAALIAVAAVLLSEVLGRAAARRLRA